MEIKRPGPAKRKNQRFVYQRVPKSHGLTFGTFDIESFGLGGPYADGATYTGEGEPERFTTALELFEALMNPPRGKDSNRKPKRSPYVWLAHNGAGYDFAYIAVMVMDYAQENNVVVETVQQGTKPIELVIPTDFGTVKLRDSYPFLDASLAAASKAYAPDYAKLGHCKAHDFAKLNSGPSDYYDPSCETCVSYLKGDVISLWHTYANASKLVEQVFGVSPGLTAGSTAMKAWQATIPEGHVYYRQNPSVEEFARHFCTGAFTYPGCTSELLEPIGDEKYAAITIDRSAAFAACQKEGGYPVSPGIWTTDYTADFFGLWECEAECPRNVFPMVPVTQGGKKLWSTGKGTAYVTSQQYEACISAGYQLKVMRGVFFEETEDVFGPFIRKCEGLEYPEKGKADPAVKALVKRMRNSLNGKYNIRPVMDRLYIGDDFPVGSKPVIDSDNFHFQHPLYTIEEETDAPYAQPVWYAITVARQVLEEHRLRVLMPEDQVYKFDTDSATTRPEVIRNMVASGDVILGEGYGNYKVEHNWLALQCVAPKNYLGLEEKNGEIVEIGNCKGIPVRTMKLYREGHKRAAQGEKVQVEFESTRTLIAMFKERLETPGIKRRRSISTPESTEGWSWDRATKRFSPIHRN
jgi:hypothetical protein